MLIAPSLEFYQPPPPPPCWQPAKPEWEHSFPPPSISTLCVAGKDLPALAEEIKGWI
jgi:hypothetical protein